MGANIGAAVAIVISTILSCWYYKSVMKRGSQKQRFIETAKKKNCVTNAEYVDSIVIFGNRDSKDYNRSHSRIRVEYEYYVDGQKYTKDIVYQNLGGVSIRYPTTITVYYDPANPRKAVCPIEASSHDQRESGCLGAVGIWIVVTVVIVNLFKMLLG
ncbi:MAG: DUF3592 domain-containing protein [Faecousia sp.]